MIYRCQLSFTEDSDFLLDDWQDVEARSQMEAAYKLINLFGKENKYAMRPSMVVWIALNEEVVLGDTVHVAVAMLQCEVKPKATN